MAYHKVNPCGRPERRDGNQQRPCMSIMLFAFLHDVHALPVVSPLLTPNSTSLSSLTCVTIPTGILAAKPHIPNQHPWTASQAGTLKRPSQPALPGQTLSLRLSAPAVVAFKFALPRRLCLVW
ncbi:hypothetical protein BDV95DRAFT_286509 [Massariosphaeria phaeospora]|uniref:Uncharacterized protein n=1 Tax=Massariosphaeria phaeospora TaxID=100035 RepID=A0A7C8MDS6_9PLEO|nr:hypothetical protein BDV95DRAFT_286509 [Massariosphaeria phaeospora]